MSAELPPDRALVNGMLRFEAALARAEAAVGIVPAEAAAAIAAVCRDWDGDVEAIFVAAAETMTPVVPLLADLRSHLPEETGAWLHFGATSQDAVDTAVSLVLRDRIGLIKADLDGLAGGCRRLADQHQRTVMTGRTLLQPALPITFGHKAAGWGAGVGEARVGLAARLPRLTVQLGGPVGNLAELTTRGRAVVRLVATDLGLAEAPLAWHTNRVRIAETASALGIAAGAVAKIAGDIVLLTQGEVGEVKEPGKPGRGGSSAMPHKENSVLSIGALAAARRTPGLVATVLASMVQEHERAAGAWQAEWPTLLELLDLTAVAAARVREAVEGLDVDGDRMRENARRQLDA